MTAEEVASDGQSIPIEGEDITLKKDGGVLKVTSVVYMTNVTAVQVGLLVARPV